MSGPVPLMTYIESFHSPPPNFVKFKTLLSDKFLNSQFLESLIPQLLARLIETFADISVKLM